MEGTLIETPTAGDLRELVETLAKQRALATARKLDVEAAETAAQATAEWAAWTLAQQAGTQAAQAVRDLETTVRRQALALGMLAGTKEPAPGVKIAKLTIFAVTDNQLAAEWARVNAPIALKVNEDVLAKIVMGLPEDQRGNIPGLRIEEREYGQVRIDKDLAPIYLKAPD